MGILLDRHQCCKGIMATKNSPRRSRRTITTTTACAPSGGATFDMRMGSEELYDMVKDPNEFTNLAADSRYSAQKLALSAQLPKINRKPVVGSANRILVYKDGTANWEGQNIDPNEAIPDRF